MEEKRLMPDDIKIGGTNKAQVNLHNYLEFRKNYIQFFQFTPTVITLLTI